MAQTLLIVAVAYMLHFVAAENLAVGSLPGNCPKNFKYVANPDVEELQGTWYGQYQFPQTKCQCTHAMLAITEGKSFTASVCCLRNNKHHCGHDVGSVSVIHEDDKPGTFMVHSKDTSAQLFILALTENHSISFACIPTTQGPPMLYVWAYTKTPKALPGFKKTFFDIMANSGLEAGGVEIQPHHEKCEYVSEKRGCHSHHNRGYEL